MRRIKVDKKRVDNFCKKYHVTFLALFGSVLTAYFTAKSDIDVLIKFEKKYTPNLFAFIDMESELSEIFGRKVDLKTQGDLSPYFRFDVLANAKPLYG